MGSAIDIDYCFAVLFRTGWRVARIQSESTLHGSGYNRGKRVRARDLPLQRIHRSGHHVRSHTHHFDPRLGYPFQLTHGADVGHRTRTGKELPGALCLEADHGILATRVAAGS